MAAAFKQIPPFPPLPKGGKGEFGPADGLSEQHRGQSRREQTQSGRSQQLSHHLLSAQQLFELSSWRHFRVF